MQFTVNTFTEGPEVMSERTLCMIRRMVVDKEVVVNAKSYRAALIAGAAQLLPGYVMCEATYYAYRAGKQHERNSILLIDIRVEW